MTPPSSTSSREPSAASSNQQARQPQTSNEPPRRQAETRTLGERFSAKMDRANEDGSRASARGDEGSGKPVSQRSSASDFDSLSGQNGQQSEGDLARADMARILKGGEPQALGNQATVNTADSAMLERMAAQIAESWPSASKPAVEITFPPGALAQGAHLQRQADGSIAIRIAGLDPKLNALRAGYAQLALLHGLDRRRLKIASLEFEKSRGAQRGRLSEIPKTV